MQFRTGTCYCHGRRFGSIPRTFGRKNGTTCSLQEVPGVGKLLWIRSKKHLTPVTLEWRKKSNHCGWNSIHQTWQSKTDVWGQVLKCRPNLYCYRLYTCTQRSEAKLVAHFKTETLPSVYGDNIEASPWFSRTRKQKPFHEGSKGNASGVKKFYLRR